MTKCELRTEVWIQWVGQCSTLAYLFWTKCALGSGH